MNKRYEAIYGAAVVAIAKEWFTLQPRIGERHPSILRAAERTDREQDWREIRAFAHAIARAGDDS